MHLKKGPFPKERRVFQAAFFTGWGGQPPLTHGHAEVLPPEAVALCRSKSPDAFIMLDAAHGFFGSLAAAQI